MAHADRPETVRPDPDALLALAGSKRGRLTVFLGAAPGVGKTYAMLSRAGQLKHNGVDIVVGLVETHGRADTAGLLDGLEVLPRRKPPGQAAALDEFDLDAALIRKPRIIVVDELAHTNAPESRHPKRHQDIEELLNAGIDVWTAMNIQHLESLSDVVAAITGVTVRERVPDNVLNRADDVLLVDLSPAELLTRLQEGKIYLPGNAERAAASFFKVGNLTALREMALRRTADRVDDQMVDYLKQNAIEGPWQTVERLLVCIGPDVLSEKVMRTAARLASGLNAPWLVVSIERTDRETADAAGARRLDETFRLAEQLGAETRRVTGRDFVEEILRLARREHVTQIVIGGRQPKAWLSFLHPSLPDMLMRRARGLGVYVVTDAAVSGPERKRRPARPTLAMVVVELAGAAASVIVASGIGIALDTFFDLPNLSMLFLLAVLASAIYAGRTAAFAAAVLSVFAYNFFFIDPVYSLSIAEPHEVFALAIFLVAAFLAGGIASSVRDQAKSASRRAAATQALYDFSRKLSGTAKSDDVLYAAVNQMQATLRRGAVLLLPEDGELKLGAAWPPETELAVADMTAARWAFEKKEPAGSGTGTLPTIAFQFRPLTTPQGVVGVCGISLATQPMDIGDERALSAILDQTAIAMDRAKLTQESVTQASQLERERFRTALLSSISHDLRTPLATITGSVTSLRQLGVRMSAASRDDLLQSIEEEAGRLSRFVSNLLDMTRIEAGEVNAKKDWVDIGDVVRSAVERARKTFPGHDIETSIAGDLPMIRGDSVLLGQVLFNLLDNAMKYAGEDTVNIYAKRDGPEIVLSVTDQGKGIPARDLDRIFEKFYRRSKADGRAPGTGLGLSISRGFVEAMGGRIKAESPAQRKRGTRIVMRFPAADPVPADGGSR